MRRDDLIALLAEAMPGLNEAADAAGEPCWKVALAATRRATAVRLHPGWIDVEAALNNAAGLDSLGLLHLQSVLPGSFKIARRHDRHDRLALRAELPIVSDTAAARDWLRRQAALVYSGLGAATVRERYEAHAGGARVAGAQAGAQSNTAAESADHVAFEPHLLAERCAAGGWRAKVAHDALTGEDAVRVELPSRAARVAVLSRSGSAMRAAVTLETGALAGLALDSQRAVADLLLRATRSLRWVRGFGNADGAAGFECLLAPPVDDQPLTSALDALAAACELYGREAEALAESPLLASHYLAVQPDSRPGRNDHSPGVPASAQAPTPVSPDSVPDAGAVDLVLV